MERIRRDGEDVCRAPQFNPHFSSSVLGGRDGIPSSLGGFPELGGRNKEEGGVI